MDRNARVESIARMTVNRDAWHASLVSPFIGFRDAGSRESARHSSIDFILATILRARRLFAALANRFPLGPRVTTIGRCFVTASVKRRSRGSFAARTAPGYVRSRKAIHTREKSPKGWRAVADGSFELAWKCRAAFEIVKDRRDSPRFAGPARSLSLSSFAPHLLSELNDCSG